MFWPFVIFLAVWEGLVRPLTLRGLDLLVIRLCRGNMGIRVTHDRYGRHLFIPTDEASRAKLDAVAGNCPRYWFGGRVIPDARYHDVYEAAHHGENAQLMCLGPITLRG